MNETKMDNSSSKCCLVRVGCPTVKSLIATAATLLCTTANCSQSLAPSSNSTHVSQPILNISRFIREVWPDFYLENSTTFEYQDPSTNNLTFDYDLILNGSTEIYDPTTLTFEYEDSNNTYEPVQNFTTTQEYYTNINIENIPFITSNAVKLNHNQTESVTTNSIESTTSPSVQSTHLTEVPTTEDSNIDKECQEQKCGHECTGN